MRIAICDDDILIVKDVHEKISNLMLRFSINAMIYDFTDAEDLLYEIESTGIFDIIFLDIEIGQINGINLALELRDRHYAFTLIFISQYDTYYKAAFEVQPFWFLDKPCVDEELAKVLKKAIDRGLSKEEIFDFSFSKVYYRIFVDDILYFESNKRSINIHCVDDVTYKCYNKLSNIENEFMIKNRQFIRIHRSYFVNTLYIKRYNYEYLELYNGEKLIISTSRREEVREKYVKMLSERIT